MFSTWAAAANIQYSRVGIVTSCKYQLRITAAFLGNQADEWKQGLVPLVKSDPFLTLNYRNLITALCEIRGLWDELCMWALPAPHNNSVAECRATYHLHVTLPFCGRSV